MKIKKASKKILMLVVLLLVCCVVEIPPGMEPDSSSTPTSSKPQEIVNLQEFITGIVVELVYATDDNVYGKRIYDIDQAYLRKGTAEKLSKVQTEAAQKGLSLKIWDAYRPPEAQYKLWEVMPDSRYVINPHHEYSYHSRGVAVDLTLVDEKGRELAMLSKFDEFSALADRDYSDVSAIQAANAQYLEEIMVRHGFISIFYEWWHFIDSERDKYPVIQESELPE